MVYKYRKRKSPHQALGVPVDSSKKNVRKCKKHSEIVFHNGEVLEVEMPYLLMRKRLSLVQRVYNDNLCK